MDKQKNGVGSLNEHTLHLSIKNYIEPDTAFHEKECCGFIVDILRGNCITEIETRSFSNMKKKLGKLIDNHKVTVVYPIAATKWVTWIDPVTGELSERRRSPKKGRASDVFYELYKLKDFLKHENFSLKLIFAEISDYRRRDGWGNSGKRGSTREERVPEAILGELTVSLPSEYAGLVDIIPEGEFTAAEFAKLNRMKPRYAWYVLDILSYLSLIERSGSRGRAFLYRKSEQFV